MESDEASSDAMLDTVKRRALTVIDLPEAEREEQYELYRKLYVASAVNVGMTVQKARELAEKMNEWTRVLVEIIEEGGGARGGHA